LAGQRFNRPSVGRFIPFPTRSGTSRVFSVYLVWLTLFAASGWLASQVFAEIDTDTAADTAETMMWPMLPGESVDQLAALFYPGDRAMQRRFVTKTRALSATMNPGLDSAAPFRQAGVIVIPDIKALSREARAFKQPSMRRPDKLQMSYEIKDAGSIMVTPQMEAEYESLSQRNQALKDNLQRLNAKLAKLQLEMAAMLGQATTGLKASAVTTEAPEAASVAEAPARPNPPAATTTTSLALKAEPALRSPTGPATEIKPVVEQHATGPSEATVSTAPVQTAAEPIAAEPEIPATSPKTRIAPPPVSPPAAIESSIWLDDDLKLLLMQFAMMVLGLILALFAWRWLRKQLARKITKVTDEQLDGLRKNTFSADESGFFNTEQPYHVADDMGVLSVEEFDSVVDEARILVSMDRINEAISLLRHHIEEQPRASLQPWIYLLDLFRTLEKQDDFTELAKRFHMTFNVMAPQWEHKQVAMIVATTLEEFPHIIDQLQSMWPNPEAKDYLEALIKDNREGERAGFSIEVAKEIALLIAILETRDS
jgi:hypothetical protein